MGFNAKGNFSVTITNAIITSPKYNTENDPDKFDIALMVRDEITGCEDAWRGEISSKMITAGKFSGKPQYEATLDSLQKAGWKHGFDFAKLPEMIGGKTVVGVTEREYNGSMYYDVKYLGNSTDAPVAIVVDDIAARMARMQKASAPVHFAAPAPQAPIAAPIPQAAPQMAPQPQVQQVAPAPQVQQAPPMPQMAPAPQVAPQMPAMPKMPQAPQ